MPAILTRGYHPAQDVSNKKGSVIDKFDGSDEDAVAHVFDWLVYDEKSPFLNEFCVSVANRSIPSSDFTDNIIPRLSITLSKYWIKVMMSMH